LDEIDNADQVDSCTVQMDGYTDELDSNFTAKQISRTGIHFTWKVTKISWTVKQFSWKVTHFSRTVAQFSRAVTKFS